MKISSIHIYTKKRHELNRGRNKPKGCVTAVAAATDIPLVPKWYTISDGDAPHFAFTDPTINIQATNQKNLTQNNLNNQPKKE